MRLPPLKQLSSDEPNIITRSVNEVIAFLTNVLANGLTIRDNTCSVIHEATFHYGASSITDGMPINVRWPYKQKPSGCVVVGARASDGSDSVTQAVLPVWRWDGGRQVVVTNLRGAFAANKQYTVTLWVFC